MICEWLCKDIMESVVIFRDVLKVVTKLGTLCSVKDIENSVRGTSPWA